MSTVTGKVLINIPYSIKIGVNVGDSFYMPSFLIIVLGRESVKFIKDR